MLGQNYSFAERSVQLSRLQQATRDVSFTCCSGADPEEVEHLDRVQHSTENREPRSFYESTPKPPPYLWDVRDEQFLELARCRAFIRVTKIDPKQGTFQVRLKCRWSFRTRNSLEQAEIVLRGVPGIRMPGLQVTVEESRIWKDLTFKSSARLTDKTIFWRGISLFTMDGFKAFNMIEFPFDRHLLNLEKLEFVWRTEFDAADYFKSMKLVLFTVDTSSMLTEWRCKPALMHPLNEMSPSEDDDAAPDQRLGSSRSGPNATCVQDNELKAPCYASKFTVHLRIERRSTFYAWQVFLVTYLITMLSCTPLGMPPKENNLGTRLNMYAAGVLTLVTFKYGIADHLPCVPYQTFADRYLLFAIATVFACAVATLYPYRLTLHLGDQLRESDASDDSDDSEPYPHYTFLDWLENIVGLLVFLAWTASLPWVFLLKPVRRRTWEDILADDERYIDDFGKEVREAVEEQEGALDPSTPGPSTPALVKEKGARATQSISASVFSGSPSRGSRAARELGARVEDWSPDEVGIFLDGLQLKHCVRQFRDKAVDGRKMSQWSEEDFQRELGLSRLQARKVVMKMREFSESAALAHS